MQFNQFLTPDHQEVIYKKWKPVMEAGGQIKDHYTAVATALVMENTEKAFKNPRLSESYAGIVQSNGGMGAGPGTNLTPNGGGALGSNHDFTDYVNDMRMPQVVIPTLRRIFPELIAHNVVGVQPMSGPVGFAFALRAKYGVNRQGVAGDTSVVNEEIGYNRIYSDFTGASGLTAEDKSAFYSETGSFTNPGHGSLTPAESTNTFWHAFTGGSDAASLARANGLGADMANAEWWKIGEDMPMSQFSLEKGIVEAKTRKLGAHWSLELGEDMQNMHGINTQEELLNIMSYEIQAEIDRQLLGEMVKSALNGTAGLHYSTWSPVSADGRNQIERIGTLYTQVLINAHKVAINTRRGPANFAFAGTKVCSLLERLGDFAMDKEGDSVATIASENASITKAGTIRHGAINLYRDTFGGDYILMGYKGKNPYDSGIIYCPYIPLQMMNAVGTQDFTPRMGVRTRYGVLNHLFGAANYYHMMKIEGLTAAGLGDDSNGRLFTY